ncbi:hypothetical protein B2J88_15865 [Rhodococcus sp. SRB_17]|uniref:hypothetical protein n=1 Tax=Rhodococcus sp. OK302 TaxID=1882769 RepID=UPI000B941277|nr:hypothetical protein [Rhodococcus sp. OK302]NMM85825.1 hypothetical protein [Rhodococcus sp. SRB_17]OYD69582.1 membrane protein [Rhodococcus sp. OK302]
MRYESTSFAVAESKERVRTWVSATGSRQLCLRIGRDVMRAGIVDSAMTLAAQSFTSLLPVIIAVGALDNLQPIAAAFFDTYGVDLSGLETGASPSAAFGVIGVLMLIVSATSFARALGRMYARTWLVPTTTFRQAWSWLAVVVVVALAVALVMWCSSLSDVHLVGVVLEPLAVFVVWALAWTVVPRLLTGQGLTGRMLVFAGFLTATGLTVLDVLSGIFLPRMAQSSEDQFGVLGLMFTFVGWLFVYSTIVVTAACISSSFSRDAGSLGAWLRSSPTGEGHWFYQKD